jgi:hypothetical protein
MLSDSSGDGSVSEVGSLLGAVSCTQGSPARKCGGTFSQSVASDVQRGLLSIAPCGGVVRAAFVLNMTVGISGAREQLLHPFILAYC